MTLIKPYSASFYVGDNETKEFPFTFDEVSESFVKVLVSHADGSVSIPTYTVDLQLKQVVFGDETPAPTDDDVVCIYRATPVIQDTPFRTLQGYNAQALENILSKIVAMIQEIKSTYFSTQVLQGDPWQLDLLKSEDNGATVNIDYVAKKLVKGLYFQIKDGNLQVSADGNSYITMPKSSDIVEFRQVQTVLPDLTVQYRLQYRIGNEWFNAESNAEATADEALRIAEEARDTADDAKDIAQDASDKVDGFDDRITQAEQDASDAKDIAQDASDAVSAHITDTNNPHSVTASQVGALPNTTKYGAVLSLTINSTTYVLTAQLKDQDGNNLGTAQTIDLPLESVVVSGAYDSATKEVVLTLQDGSKIRFSVADLVSGLQTEITALNMLSADLVDDTSTTHKFVTTTEKTTWNGKQDAISDLATIRSGASAGATAVQPADLATVATTGDYDDLLNKPTLATVATSGSYNDLSNKPTIPTVNNSTITITQGGVTKGSFTLNQATGDTIALDAGGGSANIDNLTITTNADDEIQAVATVNQNTATGATNPIYDWVGTFEEYQTQNIATLHPDWLCFIKNKPALNRYLVEAQYPTAENNYTWYFLYNDGWVEQGGIATISSDGLFTVTYPIAMTSGKPQVIATPYNQPTNSTGDNNYIVMAVNIGITTMQIRYFDSDGSSWRQGDICWEVKGMAA